jgi:hypothetical protein
MAGFSLIRPITPPDQCGIATRTAPDRQRTAGKKPGGAQKNEWD